MAHITKVFDLFYKRFPTGSTGGYSGYLTEDWATSSSLTGLVRISQSFLNFPDDTSGSQYITTRDTASLNNKSFRAIPWGSHAADFLWNVTVPSWSYYEDNWSEDFEPFPSTTPVNVTRFYTLQFVSKSFNREYQTSGSNFGVPSYNITSSWKVIDPKLTNPGVFPTRFGQNVKFYHLHSLTGSSAYPTFLYSTPLSSGESSSSLDYISYTITYPQLTPQSTSSIDGQYFDQVGGASITRTDISRSLVTESLKAFDDTEAGITAYTRALKSRRLYFPTRFSGSGTVGGTDYWFKKYTGYNVNSIFNENGGIYNVKLTLKRSTQYLGMYPDTGSYMKIFIHNVDTNVPAVDLRNPGADGWYPPDNNIITIGHGYQGGPELSFYDILTGYIVEKFNFNVVQYGVPAQFCLEAGGSLNSGSFFGIIVDDIQICKVGVTTDPRFIKPTTIGLTTFYSNPVPVTWGPDLSFPIEGWGT